MLDHSKMRLGTQATGRMRGTLRCYSSASGSLPGLKKDYRHVERCWSARRIQMRLHGRG